MQGFFDIDVESFLDEKNINAKYIEDRRFSYSRNVMIWRTTLLNEHRTSYWEKKEINKDTIKTYKYRNIDKS